jgi:hypothetical protein
MKPLRYELHFKKSCQKCVYAYKINISVVIYKSDTNASCGKSSAQV